MVGLEEMSLFILYSSMGREVVVDIVMPSCSKDYQTE